MCAKPDDDDPSSYVPDQPNKKKKTPVPQLNPEQPMIPGHVAEPGNSTALNSMPAGHNTIIPSSTSAQYPDSASPATYAQYPEIVTPSTSAQYPGNAGSFRVIEDQIAAGPSMSAQYPSKVTESPIDVGPSMAAGHRMASDTFTSADCKIPSPSASSSGIFSDDESSGPLPKSPRLMGPPEFPPLRRSPKGSPQASLQNSGEQTFESVQELQISSPIKSPKLLGTSPRKTSPKSPPKLREESQVRLIAGARSSRSPRMEFREGSAPIAFAGTSRDILPRVERRDQPVPIAVVAPNQESVEDFGPIGLVEPPPYCIPKPMGSAEWNRLVGIEPSEFLFGNWNLLYTWPPQPRRSRPPRIQFSPSGHLPRILWRCSCASDINREFRILDITKDEKTTRRSCRIDNNLNMPVVFDLDYCKCHSHSVFKKLVIQRVAFDYILCYEKSSDTDVEEKVPAVVELLHELIPDKKEITKLVTTFEIPMTGDFTYPSEEEGIEKVDSAEQKEK